MAGTEVTYKSLSGSEIHAVFGNIKFAELQMLKYAISRQKAPVYTMGSADLRAVARGARSINGALVFSHLSIGGLVNAMNQGGSRVFLSHDEQANYNQSYNNTTDKLSDSQKRALRAGGTLGRIGYVGETGLTALGAGQYDPFAEGQNVFKTANYGSCSRAFLADQLPPFDITLVGIPETACAVPGQEPEAMMQSLVLRGVEIVSEASGTSIEDLVIEVQQSFIARTVRPWANPDDKYNPLHTKISV